MPLPGFTEQEERQCRQLGLRLFRAYMVWHLGFAPAGSAEELGDFWVVQAKAILDYMRAAEEAQAKQKFGPSPEDQGVVQ